MSERYDYYEKDHMMYRGPAGSRTVTEKQVNGVWVSHTDDPLPIEYGAHLGVGDETGDLSPEHPDGDAGKPGVREIPRTA